MPELLISTRDNATFDLLQAATSILEGVRVRRARPENVPRILEDPEAVDALLLEVPTDDRDPAFVLPAVRMLRPKLPVVAVFTEKGGYDLRRFRSEFQLQGTLQCPIEPFALLQRLTRLTRGASV